MKSISALHPTGWWITASRVHVRIVPFGQSSPEPSILSQLNIMQTWSDAISWLTRRGETTKFLFLSKATAHRHPMHQPELWLVCACRGFYLYARRKKKLLVLQNSKRCYTARILEHTATWSCSKVRKAAHFISWKNVHNQTNSLKTLMDHYAWNSMQVAYVDILDLRSYTAICKRVSCANTWYQALKSLPSFSFSKAGLLNSFLEVMLVQIPRPSNNAWSGLVSPGGNWQVKPSPHLPVYIPHGCPCARAQVRQQPQPGSRTFSAQSLGIGLHSIRVPASQGSHRITGPSDPV